MSDLHRQTTRVNLTGGQRERCVKFCRTQHIQGQRQCGQVNRIHKAPHMRGEFGVAVFGTGPVSANALQAVTYKPVDQRLRGLAVCLLG